MVTPERTQMLQFDLNVLRRWLENTTTSHLLGLQLILQSQKSELNPDKAKNRGLLHSPPEITKCYAKTNLHLSKPKSAH